MTTAIGQALGGLDNVEIRHIDQLYGSNFNAIDVAAEQAAHERAERIVYLFPIQWFNLTPMLKAYLNSVWAFGWAFGPGGNALHGKEMLVITSAGAPNNSYQADGLMQASAEQVLTPMETCAYYVGMNYAKPVIFYGAMGADAATLAGWQQQAVQAVSTPIAGNLKGKSTRRLA